VEILAVPESAIDLDLATSDIARPKKMRKESNHELIDYTING